MDNIIHLPTRLSQFACSGMLQLDTATLCKISFQRRQQVTIRLEILSLNVALHTDQNVPGSCVSSPPPL